jgi:hypothetical protein
VTYLDKTPIDKTEPRPGGSATNYRAALTHRQPPFRSRLGNGAPGVPLGAADRASVTNVLFGEELCLKKL